MSEIEIDGEERKVTISEIGVPGPPGFSWTMVIANVEDGERVVQQVVDWVGGSGTKPATGKYLGETGLVDDIEDATDVRGAQGDITEELEQLRDDTEGFKDAAEAAATAAENAQADAETARDDTLNLKNDAVTAKDDAVAAKEQTEELRDEVADFREELEDFKDELQIIATDITNYAEAVETTAEAVASDRALAEAAVLAAEAAAEAAETGWDQFDDKYLGAKASNPSTDNDGDPLVDGAIYWNTTAKEWRVYDLGSDTWVPLAGGDSASAISFVPYGALVSTNVQDALAELEDNKMPLSYLDTDDTLSADSDGKVPSQKAVKAYVDGLTSGDHQPHADILDALSELSDTGILVHVGSGDVAARAITGESGVITITYGDGKTNNPVIGIATGGIALSKLADQAQSTLLGRASGAGTGAPVALTAAQAKTLLSLNNVNNTSDANKPVSTATQTALDAKVNISAIDTDSTFAANSDTKIPSQKAVKTAVDAKMPSSYLDTDASLTANSDSKVASQKATKTYIDQIIADITYAPAVLPSLDLRPLDPSSIQPDWFTRSSVATYLGPTGLIKTAAANEARFEFNEKGEALGLLIEEERTNIVKFSTDFGDSSWAKSRVTLTANAAVAPDGTNTATKVVANTEENTHGLVVNGSGFDMTASKPWTLSVFIKAEVRSRLRLRLGTNVGFIGDAIFNVADGVIQTISSGVTGVITPFGNGWYRCSITGTTQETATLASSVGFYTSTDTANVTYPDDNISGIYIWGAQFEEGAFATSYIPTTGAAASRAADVFYVPTSPEWHNPLAGTIFAEATARNVVPTGVISGIAGFFKGTANTFDYQAVRIGAGNALSAVIGNANSFSGNGLSGQNIAVGETFRMALAGQGTDAVAAARGSAAAALSGGKTWGPDVDRFYIGSQGGTTRFFNGHIRRVAYYPARLSNSDLQEMTK